MLNISMAGVINQLTDQFLDRTIPTDYSSFDLGNNMYKRKGLLFEINADVSHYRNDQRVEVRGYAKLVLCGNTSVWVAVDLDPEPGQAFFRNLSFEDWVNTSNHDSCWRSDGVESPLNKIYFELCERVNNKLSNDPIAPIAMHTFNTFNFGKLFREVDVIYSPEKDSYRKKLIEIKSR